MRTRLVCAATLWQPCWRWWESRRVPGLTVLPASGAGLGDKPHAACDDDKGLFAAAELCCSGGTNRNSGRYLTLDRRMVNLVCGRI
jgi:hypothetical protein